MVATVPRVLTYCSACAVPAPETNFCDGPTSARRLLESVAQRQMCTQVIDACAAAHDEGTRNDHSQAEADHRRGADVVRRCDRRPRAWPRDRPGSTGRTRAAGILARVSGRQPVRPVSLVPGGSYGADRQSSCESGDLGQQRVPHVLVRLSRAGQCRPEHLRGRISAPAASAPSQPHSAASAGMVLGPVHPDDVVPVTAEERALP